MWQGPEPRDRTPSPSSLQSPEARKLAPAAARSPLVAPGCWSTHVRSRADLSPGRSRTAESCYRIDIDGDSWRQKKK